MMTHSVVRARHLIVPRDPTVLWDWRVRIAGNELDVACGVSRRFDRALSGAERQLRALPGTAVAEICSASLDLDTGHAYRRDALVCRGTRARNGSVVWHRS